MPRSAIVNYVDEAMAALDEVGLPVIIRPAFTLGGKGGGVAHTEEEYRRAVAARPRRRARSRRCSSTSR